MVHDRKVDGKDRKLAVSGKVKNGNLIMYDTESESLWHQATGEALEGELKGKILKEISSQQCTKKIRWDEWKKQHPDTLVMVCGHCDDE